MSIHAFLCLFADGAHSWSSLLTHLKPVEPDCSHKALPVLTQESIMCSESHWTHLTLLELTMAFG